MARVVAFLQNAWFRDVDRVLAVAKRAAERWPEEGSVRNRLLDIWNFGLRQSYTGRQLLKALGEDLYDEIHWDNASTQLGRKSSAKFPAEPEHIKSVLEEHKPELVLAFGRVAGDALPKVWQGKIIY